MGGHDHGIHQGHDPRRMVGALVHLRCCPMRLIHWLGARHGEDQGQGQEGRVLVMKLQRIPRMAYDNPDGLRRYGRLLSRRLQGC